MLWFTKKLYLYTFCTFAIVFWGLCMSGLVIAAIGFYMEGCKNFH